MHLRQREHRAAHRLRVQEGDDALDYEHERKRNEQIVPHAAPPQRSAPVGRREDTVRSAIHGRASEPLK